MPPTAHIQCPSPQPEMLGLCVSHPTEGAGSPTERGWEEAEGLSEKEM